MIYLFNNRKRQYQIYIDIGDIDKYVDYIIEDLLPDRYFNP